METVEKSIYIGVGGLLLTLPVHFAGVLIEQFAYNGATSLSNGELDLLRIATALSLESENFMPNAFFTACGLILIIMAVGSVRSNIRS